MWKILALGSGQFLPNMKLLVYKIMILWVLFMLCWWRHETFLWKTIYTRQYTHETYIEQNIPWLPPRSIPPPDHHLGGSYRDVVVEGEPQDAAVEIPNIPDAPVHLLVPPVQARVGALFVVGIVIIRFSVEPPASVAVVFWK